jgi:hypothetical protein
MRRILDWDELNCPFFGTICRKTLNSYLESEGFIEHKWTSIGGLVYRRMDVYLEIAYNPEDSPYSPDIGLSFAPNTYDKAARPTGIPLWFILCPDTPARSYPSWTFKTEDDLKSVLTRIQADVLDPYAKPLWLECDRLKQCIGSFRAQFRQ